MDSSKGRLIRNLLIAVVVLLVIIAASTITILFRVRVGGIPVAVLSFSPTGEVPQTTNITIEFSRDVVDDSLVGVTISSAPVVFSPEIPGVFKWIARRRLRFYPDVLLLPSTDYAASILPKIITQENAYLKGTRKFTFYTSRFRVENAFLSLAFGPEVKKQVMITGELRFNYSVEPEEVKRNLSLRYKDGGTIPVEITTKEPSTAILFETSAMDRWDEARTVILRVGRRLKPVEGNLGLYGDFEQSALLKTGGEVKVESVTPEQRGVFGTFRIRLSSPVSTEEAEQYVSVEPEIEYEVTARHSQIELLGDFTAGKGYTITIEPGMMAQDGAILPRQFSTRVTLQNLEPSIDFVGEGMYLSREGNLNIGLATINTDRVNLEIQKVYANNLIYLLHTGDISRTYYSRYRYGYNIVNLGKEILRNTIEIQSRPNEEIITPINLGEYIDDERIGVFSIGAYAPEQRWRSAHRWVMITDLGIMAKKSGDELLVWLNSLSTLDPVRGAEVSLISRNNQVMFRGKTDAAGLIAFSNTSEMFEEFEPFLIVASYGKDMSFIQLSASQISTGDFDTGGDLYLRSGYSTYLYTERGVYRPGEKAHLVALVREQGMAVPSKFPLRVEVLGPDNRVLHEFKKETNDEGACEYEIDLPDYTRTGRYTARVFVGKDTQIGWTAFSVEEFMPDRMKVRLETDSSAYMVGADLELRVEAVNLFGPPAKGRRTEMALRIESSLFRPLEWKHFTFNNPEKQFVKQDVAEGEVELDDQGKHTFEIALPPHIDAPSGLRGRATVSVFEPGGRAVTTEHTFTVHPHTHYVGMRRLEEGYAEIDKPTDFEFIVLDREQAVSPDRECEVNVFEVIYQSVLRRTGGRAYRYVSEKQEKLIETFKVVSGSRPEGFSFAPRRYGRYRVELVDKGSGSTASVYFYVSGWGYAPWAMDKPERLEIGLDKPSYRPGETAKIQIRAPFPGKLILTVERERILEHRVVVMSENTATLSLPVTGKHRPNVYVSASVIRSTRSLERHAPVRAFGVVPLMVDCGDNKLDVEISAPDEMRPKGELEINFVVKGAGRSSYVTVAAVDEGILQLTDYKTPNPFDFFFGKKQLEVSSHDLYSAVLPEVEAATSPKSPSGGLAEAERRKRLVPLRVARVKPVALWSGLVKTDGQGKGSVTLDVPQFNGTLRVMVTSFAGSKFEGTSKNIIVRDAVVLTPTFPRFISSFDEFIVPVSIFNGTGEDGDFEIALDVTGPVAQPEKPVRRVSLRSGEEGQIFYELNAMQGMDKVTFTLMAEGAGERAQVITEVPLRPASPPVTLTGSGAVKGGTKASFELPGDFLEGSTQFDLIIAGFPAVRFASSLQYLLTYPHGCAEQTTSKVFPLLYFNDLARLVEPELFGTRGADYFINEGIKKLENMQQHTGRFTFWPRGSGFHSWTSIYVTHFLVEARKADYVVSDRVYRRMIGALESDIRTPMRDRWQRELRAYGCYVLAAAGRPNRSAMLYLKNNLLDSLSDYSQFHLAGAFALSGDMDNAFALLPGTVEPRDVKRESGLNFNSSTRAAAIMLDILAEVKPNHPSIPKLVQKLSESASARRRWYNTQDNAFGFMALGKIMRKQESTDYQGEILVDGIPYSDFDSEEFRTSEKDWGGKTITIKTEGTGTCYYYWKAFGLPSEPDIPEYDRELVVRRDYFTGEGYAIDDNVFQQGDLVIARISCKALTEELHNVIVTDMLPAGLEIENPRLESRAGVEWIGKRHIQPEYMDIRDDRMLLSTTLPLREERNFYYALRVVTEGKFVLPPVVAEAMYDPEKSSVACSGMIEVGK